MEREHSPFFSLAAFLLTHHLIKAYRAKFSSPIPLAALSPHSALPAFLAVFHPASALSTDRKQKSKDWLDHRESEERCCHSFRRVTIAIRARTAFSACYNRRCSQQLPAQGLWKRQLCLALVSSKQDPCSKNNRASAAAWCATMPGTSYDTSTRLVTHSALTDQSPEPS